MRIAKDIIETKTGNKGHIFYLDHDPKPDRVYHVRFKGEGGGYVGKTIKGSQFSVF
jgi:hypothetical protein